MILIFLSYITLFSYSSKNRQYRNVSASTTAHTRTTHTHTGSVSRCFIFPLWRSDKGLRDLSPLFEGERGVSEGPHVASDVPESQDPPTTTINIHSHSHNSSFNAPGHAFVSMKLTPLSTPGKAPSAGLFLGSTMAPVCCSKSS